MTKTAFVYTDAYTQYEYSKTHPLKPYRLQLTRDLMQSYGLLDLPHSRMVETVPAQRTELEWFHTPDYLDVLEAADVGMYREDYGAYGLGPGDNPSFPACTPGHNYAWGDIASCAAGGIGRGGRGLSYSGRVASRHARSGVGFCYVNDPVIAIKELVQHGYRLPILTLMYTTAMGYRRLLRDRSGSDHFFTRSGLLSIPWDRVCRGDWALGRDGAMRSMCHFPRGWTTSCISKVLWPLCHPC